MPFSRPTLSTLLARTKSDVSTRLPGAVASLRRTVEKVLATMVAGTAHGLHGHLVWVSRQLIPDTAEANLLVRWASIWGVEKTAATKAAGSVTITGTNTTVCPDGTLWQTPDQVIYTQNGDATIVGGSAVIAIEAEEAGADGNLEIGDPVSLVSPVAGIDTDGTVSGTGVTGGFDEESNDALLARLLLRLQNPPKGGGPYDYVNWALEVAGTTRAWEFAGIDGVGTVAVYFVMDNKVATIIPDNAEVSVMQTHLDGVVPITVVATAYAPTPIVVDFTIEVVPDTATVRAAVEAELEAYITREARADGVTFPLSQLTEAISSAPGETDHTMTVPATAPVFTVGQIAVMGTITWV